MDNLLPKVVLFIPTYQCQDQVQRVISKISIEIQKSIDLILLVDNRSIDETITNAVIASSNIELSKFLVLKNVKNYGLGGSHKIAFQYALDNEFEYLIVLHGDDQADIKDALDILDNKFSINADCYLGSRFMQGSKLIGYSNIRTVGNYIFNGLFSILVGKRIFDLGSGLNLYKLKSFKDRDFMKYPDDLMFNYVMLMNTYLKKQVIHFFPIHWVEEDQISNVKFLSHCLKVFKIWAICLISKKYFLQRSWVEEKNKDYKSQEIFLSEPSS